MSASYTAKTVTLLASAARTASADGSATRLDQSYKTHTADRTGWMREGTFVLDVTAASGTTPTLDVVIQGRTSGSGTWVDLPGGTFTRKVTTGSEAIRISGPLLTEIRASATIAGSTPSFTFSVIGHVGG